MATSGGLIQRSVGGGLAAVAIAMLPSIAADAVAGNSEWRMFGLSALVTGFVAAAALIGAQGKRWDLAPRSVVPSLLITIAAMAVAAAIPFAQSNADLSAVDALFESISALTTTGTTVIPRLSDLLPGLALFRGTLQWLGGLLALSLGIAILPFLKMGGMQFFHVDIEGGKTAVRRIRRLAMSLISLYCGMTLVLALALSLAGMSGLDALVWEWRRAAARPRGTVP